MTPEKLPEMFRALGDQTRLNTLGFLAACGPQGANAGGIERFLNIKSNVVGHHTGTLEAAGLVTSQKSGRYVVYRIVPEAMEYLTLHLLNLHKVLLRQKEGEDANNQPSPAGTA